MFFSSGEVVEQFNPGMTPIDVASIEGRYRPSIGEYAKANMAQAFDRTMGVRVVENVSLLLAERDFEGKRYATEEEWKASPYYRQGIEFVPDMTEIRARRYAEYYDIRRKHDAIVRGGDTYGSAWLYKPVGFGAGMIGSLPDPVNLIPGGVALKGARLAGATLGQIAKKSIVPGLVSGAGGNFVSSTFAAIDLNPKGEDITYQDVLLDTMMGAVLGIGFATGGGLIGRKTTRNAMRRQAGEMRRGLEDAKMLAPEKEKQLYSTTEIDTLIEGMKKNDPDAYNTYGKQLESVFPGVDTYNQAIDFWRNRATPEQRLTLSQALETAMRQHSMGQPIQVADIIKSAEGKKAIDAVAGAINDFKKLQAEDFSSLRAETETRVKELEQQIAQAEASVRVGNDLVDASAKEMDAVKNALGVSKKVQQQAVRYARLARRAAETAVEDLERLRAEREALGQKLVDLEISEANFAAVKNIADTNTAFLAADAKVRAAEADLAKAKELKATPSSKKKVAHLENVVKKARQERDSYVTVLDRFRQLEENRTRLENVDWREIDPEAVHTEPLDAPARDVEYDDVGRSIEESILEEEGRLSPGDKEQLDAINEDYKTAERKQQAVADALDCVWNSV